MKQLVIIGGGQHAIVVAEIAEELGYNVLGLLDEKIPTGTIVEGFKILGKVEICMEYPQTEFVIAIGNNLARKEISEKFPNLKWATLIHPSAIVSKRSEIGEGTVVCANAVINTLCKVGKHCIINTASVIEHGCTIGSYSHIGPTVYVPAYKTLENLTTEKKDV